jgi:cytidine deaminase
MSHSLEELISKAIQSAQQAYAPYSNYLVGASLVARDDSVHDGCNIENAVYPVGICGERTALFKAVSMGHRDFNMIVIATKNGGSPCGVCRQALYEFAPDMRVVCVDFDRNITIDTSLRNLLPYGFSVKDLNS